MRQVEVDISEIISKMPGTFSGHSIIAEIRRSIGIIRISESEMLNSLFFPANLKERFTDPENYQFSVRLTDGIISLDRHSSLLKPKEEALRLLKTHRQPNFLGYCRVDVSSAEYHDDGLNKEQLTEERNLLSKILSLYGPGPVNICSNLRTVLKAECTLPSVGYKGEKAYYRIEFSTPVKGGDPILYLFSYELKS